MMALLRTWLFGLTAVSALLALAESMVAQDSIRRVLRLAGGVLMIVVLLQPVARIDLSDVNLSLDAYRQEVADLEQSYARQQETQLAAGIEEELASYIEDKARQLGLDCQVSVTTAVGEDGIPLPRSITVTGAYSEALCQIIETDLGIPQENQNWQEAS